MFNGIISTGCFKKIIKNNKGLIYLFFKFKYIKKI